MGQDLKWLLGLVVKAAEEVGLGAEQRHNYKWGKSSLRGISVFRTKMVGDCYESGRKIKVSLFTVVLRSDEIAITSPILGAELKYCSLHDINCLEELREYIKLWAAKYKS